MLWEYKGVLLRGGLPEKCLSALHCSTVSEWSLPTVVSFKTEELSERLDRNKKCAVISGWGGFAQSTQLPLDLVLEGKCLLQKEGGESGSEALITLWGGGAVLSNCLVYRISRAQGHSFQSFFFVFFPHGT